jgi:hypothetical protein
MSRKNLLQIHEAMALALLSSPTRIMSLIEIANFIEQRNLFRGSSNDIMFCIKDFQTSNESEIAHLKLFEEIGADYIRLSDSDAYLAIKLSIALDAIEEYNNSILYPSKVKLKVHDFHMNIPREKDFSPNAVICIITKELQVAKERSKKKSGEKKFIYVKEVDLQGKDTIGIYSIYSNLKTLVNDIDPLNHYLTIVRDDTALNVQFFNISKEGVLLLNFEADGLNELKTIKFSGSKASKVYLKNFEMVQNAYLNRISFGKALLGYRKSEKI